jgi:indole-3-glycerol phosphate synthase
MILDDIIKTKELEVEELKDAYRGKDIETLANSLPKPRDFHGAFKKGTFSLIAEIKRASPSAGVIRQSFAPIYLAKAYEEAGASALSVLTDKKFFMGDISHLKSAKESTTIPVLRKDFIIDERQIYESRIAGADAILLIVRVLSDDKLLAFLKLTKGLGLGTLVEVHSKEEALRAISAGAEMIGINNRDLSTLKVDINTTADIISALPELKSRVIISESGISSKEDAKKIFQAGADGILVGEAILKSKDVVKKIRELMIES